MKYRTCDLAVTRIEKEHNLMGIKSNAQALIYFIDTKRKKIHIKTFKDGFEHQSITLTQLQAKAMAEEFKDICDMYL